jgi:thiol-disulfide isomerase/thioredoxin
MPKSRGRANNAKMSNNDMCCIAVVVVLILIGLYFFLRHHNMLGLSENFESSPMELKRLDKKPNPDNANVFIIFFYADWCPHCVRAKPEWAKLQSMDGQNVNGKKVNVRACNSEGSNLEKETAQDNNVEGYPTIKLVKNNEVVDYNGERNAEAIKNFIANNI